MTPLSSSGISLQEATEADVPLVLSLIKDLAEYERLSHEVVATEESLRDWMFGDHAVAEAGLAGDGLADLRLKSTKCTD